MKRDHQVPITDVARMAVPNQVDNLALLQQGIFTTIVRIRAGQQQIADLTLFRKRTIDQLDQIESQAARLGYGGAAVLDAKYAVVAFLDETIQSSGDPRKSDWSALQAELFGRTEAGEDFFKRLDELCKRPASPEVADTVEVFLLCLLLGYQGRYGRVATGGLKVLIEDLRFRIKQVRGNEPRICPGALPSVTDIPVTEPGDVAVKRLRWALLSAALCTAALWVLAKWMLSSESGPLMDILQVKG